MASSRFTYAPASANDGTAFVNITASTLNNNQTSKSSTLTINTGDASKIVTIVQKYRPWFLQTSFRTFPAIGGNLYFTAHTEYDVVFQDIPNWITLSVGGNVVTNNQRISSGTANNAMFTMTASANQSSDQRSATNSFCMRHYIGNTLQSFKDYLEVYQDGAVLNHLVIQTQNIPCTGGSVSGYMEMNTGDSWRAADNIVGVDTDGQQHYLISEDYMTPSTGPGNATTNFTISMPRNQSEKSITWTLRTRDGYDNSYTGTWTQDGCPAITITPTVAHTGGTATATIYTGEYLTYSLADNIVGVDTQGNYFYLVTEDYVHPYESGNFYYSTNYVITVPSSPSQYPITWTFRIRDTYDNSYSATFTQL